MTYSSVNVSRAIRFTQREGQIQRARVRSDTRDGAGGGIATLERLERLRRFGILGGRCRQC
jgi:hypothetical protein